MGAPAVVVDHVSKKYRLYRERNLSLKIALMRGGRAKYDEFWALQDVTLEVPEGSTYGLIGTNGSGKSTLLKCIAKILRPDKGSIRTQGSLAALLELGTGFHQELSGRENIYLNGSILGLSKKQINAKFDEIVSFAGVEQFVDQPVKNYSSGMYVRLGFSIAINVDPDILLVDEVLAVGDVSFQQKCLEKFVDFRDAGKTVVLVSHAMDTVRTMCDEVAWLHRGELVDTGPAGELVDRYIEEGHSERMNSLEGVVRTGSGEAQLTSVGILDADGNRTSQLRTGDPCTIRLEFDAAQRIDKPVFGLAVENGFGVYVWASNTRDADFVPDYIEGKGSVQLRVPRLPLQPGTYDISASIVDITTVHHYDYLRHCFRFDVEATTPRESGGVASFGGTWGDFALGR